MLAFQLFETRLSPVNRQLTPQLFTGALVSLVTRTDAVNPSFHCAVTV
jgi:hypothetical protein